MKKENCENGQILQILEDKEKYITCTSEESHPCNMKTTTDIAEASCFILSYEHCQPGSVSIMHVSLPGVHTYCNPVRMICTRDMRQCLGINIMGNMENGFVVSEEFPNLLAETRSEFENTVVNTLIQEDGLNEKKFDIFPNLVMKCTENQTWQFEDERLQ